jgi:hypothetical protein
MRTQEYFLRNVNDTHMRYIGLRELEELVDSGEAVNIYVRQHGKARKLIGAKLCRAVQPVNPGAPVISKSEMEMNAASKVFHGNRSRTAGMPEYRRLSNVNRHTNRVEEEDHSERTQAKVTLWPLVGDDKAIRVGPTVDVTAIETAIDLIEQQRIDSSPYRTEQHSTSFGHSYTVSVQR